MEHRTTRPETPVKAMAAADTLSTQATRSLDRMRARARKADDARAAQVVTAATANRQAAEAWDALATHAATHAAACRHGAALADRTRRRWATR